MNFNDCLAQKGQEYKPFIRGRFCQILQGLDLSKFKPKIIQIIGTNGKGSTGRFIANFLLQKGFSVGHFTSPHIAFVGERFFKNNSLATTQDLDKSLTNMRKILSEQTIQDLTYFEFLTLLCVDFFKSCDYLVLEAGLGGEFDATSCFTPILQVFTNISIDHQEILGQTIEQIATTKLKAIKSTSVLMPQEKIVQDIAKLIAKEKNQKLFIAELNGTDELLLKDEPSFLAKNRKLAFTALKHLGFTPSFKDMLSAPPFGRLTKIKKNIYVDVGHNLQSAKEMAKFFQGKKVILIYNSYKDKDYFAILKELKKITKKCFILPVENERMADENLLKNALNSAQISLCEDFSLKDDETYLVFGSFLCVNEFLKTWNKI